MSDLIFNLKLGSRHLQITRNWKLSFDVNPYWTTSYGMQQNVPWMKLYQLGSKHYI